MPVIQAPYPAVAGAQSDTFNTSIADWAAQWDAAILSNPTGVIRYRTNSGRNSVSWVKPGDVANVEVLVKIRQVTTKRSFGVSARVSGTTAERKGYFFGSNGADAFSFYRFDGVGIAATPGGSAVPAAVAFATTVNIWYWMRVSFALGALYAKIWADGSTEPIGWMAYSPDSSQSAAGRVGLLANQTFNDQECDYYAVSTDGSTIPVPAST